MNNLSYVRFFGQVRQSRLNRAAMITGRVLGPSLAAHSVVQSPLNPASRTIEMCFFAWFMVGVYQHRKSMLPHETNILFKKWILRIQRQCREQTMFPGQFVPQPNR